MLAPEALVISQCWDGVLSSVYRVVLRCPGDGIGGETCTVAETEGTLANCLPELSAIELPPADPNEPSVDELDPNEQVEPPAEMPEIDGVDEP